LNGEEIAALLKDGRIDRPDRPASGNAPTPVRGSAIPKAGKRYGGEAAPQGA